MPEKNPRAQVEKALAIGDFIGQVKALDRVSGRCDGATAGILAHIYEAKLYRSLGLSWNAFCQQKVGRSRRLVDEDVRAFKEFGPAYFDLRQVMRITPEQYRRIAPSVSGEGVAHAGETIAFTVQNAPRLVAAVAELRKAAESRAPQRIAAPALHPARDFPKLQRELEAAVKKCGQLEKQRLDREVRDRFIRCLAEAVRTLSDILYIVRL